MPTEVNTDLIAEVRRQADICNACRYCEGYCSVFPALHRERAFADGDLMQLANLCHNCRGCYYACQYTAPHEFDLNLPAVLAALRRETWEAHVWPAPVARTFHHHGVAIALTAALGFTLLLLLINAFGGQAGSGFYGVMAHNAMVALFLPAFLLPGICLIIGLASYWRSTDGGVPQWGDLRIAIGNVARMKDLAAGHGEGCNFEEEDRFSQARRWAHQAVMFGFLMCFGATAAGTVMHYLFDLPAPYGIISLPKLLGIPGGVLLTAGTLWMARLKLRADRTLGDAAAWGGEMAFVLLLGGVAFSGLVLWAFGETAAMPSLLALHLGLVLSFFLLTPFSKMAHGFFRLAALIREARSQRLAGSGH